MMEPKAHYALHQSHASFDHMRTVCSLIFVHGQVTLHDLPSHIRQHCIGTHLPALGVVSTC